jgi:tetratricopeptide (TPR) repeat protein
VIHDRLGDLRKGEDAYTQAADIFGRLYALAPENPEYRYWQAHSLAEHGELCDRLGNGKAAEDLAGQAYELFQLAAKDFPNDVLIRAGLADCCLVLGSVNFVPGPRMNALYRPDYSARRWKECVNLLRQALRLYPSVIADEPNRSDHRWRFHRAQKILSQMPDLSFAEREQLTKDSVAGFEGLVNEFPRQHRPRAELCEALVWRGVVSMMAGRPAETEATNRHALAIVDKLVDEYPKVPYYGTLQASTRYFLGALLINTDRLADAKPLLTKAAKTLEATPEGHVPPFQLWVHAAGCYRALGNIYERVERLDLAEKVSQKALMLDQRVARHHQDAGTWGLLILDTNRVATLLSQRGSTEDGIAVHRAHTEFWKDQADRQPANMFVGRCHAWSLHNLGRFLQRSGLFLQRSDFLAQADQAYREAQKVHTRIEESGLLDPASEWVRVYSDGWRGTQITRSWLYAKSGRLDEAEEARRELIRRAARQIEDAPPGTPDQRREHATAIQEIAWFLDIIGRRTTAIKDYGDAIREFDRLAKEFPNDRRHANDAVSARVSLAFLQQHAGNAAEANRVAEEAVTFLRTLPTSDQPRHRQALAEVLANQGLIRWRTGRVEDAATAIAEAVAIMDNLLADRSRAGGPRSASEGSLALVTARHAHLLEHTGHFDEAKAAYVKAVSLRRRLAENAVVGEPVGREPMEWNNPYFRTRKEWADSLDELTWFHLRRGQVEQAASHCAEARAVLEKMVDVCPADILALNQLARFLVTCPVETLRDPERAVRLTRKAVAMATENSMYVGTLGVVQFRIGDFRAAVDNLNLAVCLRTLPPWAPPWADDLFFRAMAHYRLCETEAARRDYDEALRGLEWPYYGQNAGRQQLREEAAALLGVK